MNLRTVSFLGLLLAGSAQATIEGILWDPAFDGEGWAVESQNDQSFDL